MIGYLHGQIVERGPESVTVDVSGVGYELSCSSVTMDEVAGGNDARLWVHTHMREDAIALFGFSTQLEKRLFLSFLKVNGVGPKMALKILSSGPLANLLDMIEAGDVKALSGLPKVGKKTAEQLILTLRGKLVVSDDTSAAGDGRTAAKVGAMRRFSGARGEVASALVNLGFRPQDVERAVEGLLEPVDLEQGVRQGLHVLSGGA